MIEGKFKGSRLNLIFEIDNDHGGLVVIVGYEFRHRSFSNE